MSKFTIGILGGMGPRATVYFEQLLLDKIDGPDQSLPKIVVINDGSTPDRSAFLCQNGADPLPTLRHNAWALQLFAPNIICIPCNTAHARAILDRLQAELSLPIIDMPSAALEEAVAHNYQRVTIFGTEGTRKGRVYDQRAGSMIIRYPSSSQQTLINQLIADTKQRGFVHANQVKLASLIEHITSDAVILACTELSVLNEGTLAVRPVIDALEALADQCTRQLPKPYTKESRKEAV